MDLKTFNSEKVEKNRRLLRIRINMDPKTKEFQQRFSRCLLYGNQLIERLELIAVSKGGDIGKLIVKQCREAFNFEWERIIKLATSPTRTRTCDANVFDDLMRHLDLVYRNAVNDILMLPMSPLPLATGPPKAPPPLPPPRPPPPQLLQKAPEGKPQPQNPREALLLELKVKLKGRFAQDEEV